MYICSITILTFFVTKIKDYEEPSRHHTDRLQSLLYRARKRRKSPCQSTLSRGAFPGRVALHDEMFLALHYLTTHKGFGNGHLLP